MSEEPKYNVKEKSPPRSGLFLMALSAVVAQLFSGVPRKNGYSQSDYRPRPHIELQSQRRKTSRPKRRFHRQK